MLGAEDKEVKKKTDKIPSIQRGRQKIINEDKCHVERHNSKGGKVTGGLCCLSGMARKGLSAVAVGKGAGSRETSEEVTTII